MELPKIDFRYLKEAFKEPLNFWGMAGFAVAAAFFWDVTPLLLGLGTEGIYLAVVPASPFYRRYIERREKERMYKLRDAQREAVVKAFDPREREAVEYLRWMKNQIYSNYKKFTTSKQIPANLQTLDQRWEDFVDLLDVYRRRKHHLRSINRQAVQNQLKQAEHAIQTSNDDRQKRIQLANAEILKRRVAAFHDLERSVRLVEAQLQSIENFFGLVNDQVVTLPTPERVSALHFEELSDSIAMTRQMLEETADTFGMLDNQHRELDLLLSTSSSSK
jgi:anion-transporting  ArsA/GET3 family ATPase